MLLEYTYHRRLLRGYHESFDESIFGRSYLRRSSRRSLVSRRAHRCPAFCTIWSEQRNNVWCQLRNIQIFVIPMTLSSAQSRARRPFTPFSIIPSGVLLGIFAFSLPMPRLCFLRYLSKTHTRIKNWKSNCYRTTYLNHVKSFISSSTSPALALFASPSTTLSIMFATTFLLYDRPLIKNSLATSRNYMVCIFTLSTVVPQSFFDRHFLTRFCVQCRSHTDHSLQFVKYNFVASVWKY